MWRLRIERDRMIACTLKHEDRGCSLTVTLDGGEIAARDYATTVEAVSHAAFLLERLTADGWRLVAGMPRIGLQ